MYRLEDFDKTLMYLFVVIATCICAAVFFSCYNKFDPAFVTLLVFVVYLVLNIIKINSEKYNEIIECEGQEYCVLRDKYGNNLNVYFSELESVKIHYGSIIRFINLARVSLKTKHSGTLNVTVSARDIVGLQNLFPDYVNIKTENSMLF